MAARGTREAAVSKRELAAVRRAYRVVDDQGVGRHMAEHPAVARALLAVPQHIRRVFGSRAGVLLLEHVVDPEEGAAFLSVTAEVNASPQEALEGLNRFDEWWLEQPVDVRLSLTVMVAPG